MLVTTTATPIVLSTLFLLSTTVAAAPSRTRTYCRCTFVTDAPARTNWEQPLSQSPSRPPAVDICTELGPQLENFRHTAPEQYDLYIRHTISGPHSTEVLQPLSTTVLLDAAAHNGFQRSQEEQDNEPRPTSRPNQRIVCHTETTPISAYRSTCLNFWVLEFIIFGAILAFVIEAVQLGFRWMNQRHNTSDSSNSSYGSSISTFSPLPNPSPLRLSGSEKQLLAIPIPCSPDQQSPDLPQSPGVEKKQRVYSSASFCSSPPSHWKREFLAYDEDDDDELNRPVM